MYQEIFAEEDFRKELQKDEPAVYNYWGRERASVNVANWVKELAVVQYGFKKASKSIKSQRQANRVVKRIKKMLTRCDNGELKLDADFKIEFKGIGGKKEHFDINVPNFAGSYHGRHASGYRATMWVEVNYYHIVDNLNTKEMILCKESYFDCNGDNMLEILDNLVSNIFDGIVNAADRYYCRLFNEKKNKLPKRGKITFVKQ